MVTRSPRAKKTTPPPRQLSFRERLAAATLPERVVPVCLRNDLFTQIEQLDTELHVLLAETAPDRLSGNADARRLTKEIEALRQEMTEYSEPFLLRAIPRPEFTKLELAYPPRPGNEQDLAAGVNRDDMTEDLLRRSIVSPEFTDALWLEFLTAITDWQYDQLASTAWGLNKGEVSVPLSLAALKIQRFDSESRRQQP